MARSSQASIALTLATPSNIDKSAESGAIGGTAQKIGGPLASDGAIGKQFTDKGGIGGEQGLVAPAPDRPKTDIVPGTVQNNLGGTGGKSN